jgi:hypothetical protein
MRANRGVPLRRTNTCVIGRGEQLEEPSPLIVLGTSDLRVWRGVFALAGEPKRDGKFLVQDATADGVLSAFLGSGAVDVLYEDRAGQTLFNGDIEGQHLTTWFANAVATHLLTGGLWNTDQESLPATVTVLQGSASRRPFGLASDGRQSGLPFFSPLVVLNLRGLPTLPCNHRP